MLRKRTLFSSRQKELTQDLRCSAIFIIARRLRNREHILSYNCILSVFYFRSGTFHLVLPQFPPQVNLLVADVDRIVAQRPIKVLKPSSVMTSIVKKVP